ncbi:MAG: S8 family serine peptidase [Gammaproteobacteria bacterium]|nr:S8 family serine peptidase [Gammaproteobacteria bacterium]
MLVAAMAGLVLVTARSAAPPDGPQTRFTLPHVAAQLLLKTEAGLPQEEILALLAPLGATIAATAARAPDLYVIRLPDDSQLATAAVSLEADPRIEFAEPNFLFDLWAKPNEVRFLEQWSKENTGTNAPEAPGVLGADMNMPEAWDLRSTASGVVMAIIDDGFETSHPDLIANMLLSGKCFASPENDQTCASADDPNPSDQSDFHGTLVVGAAAAHGDNGIGIAGTVWQTQVLPLKVDLSAFAVVNAIDEAIAQDANIINMSFGGPVGGRAQHEAIARAEAAGALVIAAAGNSDASNDAASHFPSNTPEPNVLSVGATTGVDEVAAFSQWGPFSVHLAAPGVSILSTTIGGYGKASGTSFAAPHTAGVAALVLAESGAADYRQLKAALIHGGIDGRTSLGPVVPGQNKSAVPGRVASGRLDAARALAGPPGGVLVARGIAIDDAAFGNGNGALDPGETAALEVRIENLWSAETGVTAALSTPDAHLLSIHDASPVVVGDIPEGGIGAAVFSITLANNIVGHEQVFLRLDLTSSAGALPSRYFYLEAGTLENGVPVSQQIQRWDWDEFQSYHLQLPVGATNLSVRTSGSGDLDLLLRHAQTPEYLISLGGGSFYYVDDETLVSGGPDAEEEISIPSPAPGLYHVVVVNYDQNPKTYQLTASYSTPDAGDLAFESDIYRAEEDAGSVVIGVRRSGGLTSASVEYFVESGTATGGEDYVGETGTLMWSIGETGLKTFDLTLFDDESAEPGERFTVGLRHPVGATVGSPSTAIVEIDDDDSSAATDGVGQGNGNGEPQATADGGGSGASGPIIVALVALLAVLQRRADRRRWRHPQRPQGRAR